MRVIILVMVMPVLGITKGDTLLGETEVVSVMNIIIIGDVDEYPGHLSPGHLTPCMFCYPCQAVGVLDKHTLSPWGGGLPGRSGSSDH